MHAISLAYTQTLLLIHRPVHGLAPECGPTQNHVLVKILDDVLWFMSGALCISEKT